MTEKERDPELRDDRDEVATDVVPVDIPEYDPGLFPEFEGEYTEDDDDGSEN
jgi:hypothetical protein